MAGVNTLKQGCIWRVVDGWKINIWNDAWPQGTRNRKVVITPRGNQIISKVHDLIDPGTGQWDEQLVRESFWVDDARHILQMHLREGVHDFIAWQFDTKGEHSVKSDYKLYAELESQRRHGGVGMSSASAGNLNACQDDSWRRIWKLPCPRTVQMFTWRVKHE